MTDVLIDVTTELTFYNEFDYLTDENYTDLIESILMLIDNNTGEKKGDGEIFVDEVIDTEEIYDLVCVQFENLFINNSDEDYIYDIIEDAVDIYNSYYKYRNNKVKIDLFGCFILQDSGIVLSISFFG